MGLIEVKRCGTAQAFKLYFETLADLKLAVESPPMVGIERLNVKNFIFCLSSVTSAIKMGIKPLRVQMKLSVADARVLNTFHQRTAPVQSRCVV